MSGHNAPSCDVFCTVVDNFGDAGVCWRLARQLAAEHRWNVRLWIDMPDVLARLEPAVDPSRATQYVDGVTIVRWDRSADVHAASDVADVVIEAFACEPPESYMAAMAARAMRAGDMSRTGAPVWINLDYLSAEDWVADYHLGASPHPRLPLTKTFFFPGIAHGTGGVLRERSLLAERAAFVDSATQRHTLWASLAVAPPPPHAVVISLFTYENPALEPCLRAWRDGPRRIELIVPEGRVSGDVAHFFGQRNLTPGSPAKAGNLHAHGVPFTDQRTYDRLLWACDVNFVRGEDSFVRAQWAQRPFVWHIYPQADDAHAPKLEAACRLYTAGLPPEAAQGLADFWRAWNAGDPSQAAGPALPDWESLWRHRAALDAHAADWARELATLGDLAGNLVKFCEKRLK